MASPLRWLVTNLSALLLSIVLATVVWATAVTEADPNVDRLRTVSIEIVGRDPGMLLVGTVQNQARITFRAPRSEADRLSNTDNAVRAWVDLSGLEAGDHVVKVQVNITTKAPVEVLQVNPETLSLTLEPLSTQTFLVRLDVKGNPADGYEKGIPARSPTEVSVSGPASLVSQVNEVHANLDISGASETVELEVPVQALDINGSPVEGVTITPGQIRVTQPISLQGGYRNVVVRVVTTGEVAPGYRLTNLTVSPPNVVVFSTNPQLVADLPSFIETDPVDITGATDDIDKIVALNLPTGISVVGDQTVLVQVSIAVQEDILVLTVPVQVTGLAAGNLAAVYPSKVDVAVFGPVPILNTLSGSDLKITIDVKDMPAGNYSLNVAVGNLPDQVQLQSVSPSKVDVTISPAPTPTPTGTLPTSTLATGTVTTTLPVATATPKP